MSRIRSRGKSSSRRLRLAISAQDAAILMPKFGLGIRIDSRNSCPSVFELKWLMFHQGKAGKRRRETKAKF
jgi:hypothetical protein